MRRLGGWLKPERALLALVVLFAVVSVAFSVVGPRILGRATNILFEGVISERIPVGMTRIRRSPACAPKATTASPT